MSDEDIEMVQTICSVSKTRALQLLKDGGSVEQAVESHLSETKCINDVATLSSPSGKVTMANKRCPTNMPSPLPSSSEKPPKKQATLDAFFGIAPKQAKKLSQRKIESFFVPKSQLKAQMASAKFPSTSSLTRVGPTSIHNEDQGLNTFRDIDEENDRKPAAIAVSAKSSAQQMASENETAPDDNKPSSQPYSWIAQTCTEMDATTKRNTKLSCLKSLFLRILQSVGGIHEGNRQDDATILTCTLDLLLGKLNIDGIAVPLQVSGSAVSTAVQTVTGISKQQLRQAYRETGDLGDVAAQFHTNRAAQIYFVTKQKPQTLTILQVHQMLRAIASVAQGKGSQKERQNLLIKLLQRAHDKAEACFLVRALLGNMRLGATIKSIVAALAVACIDGHSSVVKEGDASNQVTVDMLQEVFNLCPRVDRIANALLVGGVRYAHEICSLEVGFPVQPMLANPAHSLEDVEKFLRASVDGEFHDSIAEHKYDGIRCQAHWDGTALKLFSRHLLETTTQYPDVVQILLESRRSDVTSFVIDAEVVAVAPSDEASDGFRLLPFQELSTRRGTKRNVSGEFQLRVYAFDLLFVNGKSLVRLPLFERQDALRKHFVSNQGFGFAKGISLPRSFDSAFVENALQQSVKDGAEGLMIKLTGRVDAARKNEVAAPDLTFGYESGTRSRLWLKLKRDYLGSFQDTIDVVPIGAWYGNGRKAQKGFLSPVLFAVYDDEDGSFRSISRCMSFSDSMYNAMKDFYFRGTPYPSGVGVANQAEASVEQGETHATVAADDEDEEAVGDIDVSLEGSAISYIDQDGEATLNRVNCFDSRPSGNWIITNESPSVWFKPMEVFEVSFADLSLSRVHTAARGLVDDQDGRGVALRFPRFKRRRPDKGVEDATTSSEIAQLFHSQVKKKSSA